MTNTINPKSIAAHSARFETSHEVQITELKDKIAYWKREATLCATNGFHIMAENCSKYAIAAQAELDTLMHDITNPIELSEIKRLEAYNTLAPQKWFRDSDKGCKNHVSVVPQFVPIVSIP